MVSVSKVQCGKELRLLERREGGIQQWQGTPSADGILIKASVINAGAQGAVLLFDKKELFAPTGKEDGRITPEANDSLRYISLASRSGLARFYRRLAGRGVPGQRLMAPS